MPICSGCGSTISSSAPSCPKCGSMHPAKQGNIVMLGIIVMIALGLAGTIAHWCWS